MTSTVIVVSGYVATMATGITVSLLGSVLTRKNSRNDRLFALQVEIATEAMEYLQLTTRIVERAMDEYKVLARSRPNIPEAPHRVIAKLQLALPECATAMAEAHYEYEDLMFWCGENLMPDETIPTEYGDKYIAKARFASDRLQEVFAK